MNTQLISNWFWKWHVIAGLITLPFVLLLAITGTFYLFKADYNDSVYSDVKFVSANNTQAQSYSTQLQAAETASDKAIVAVTLPASDEHATAFKVRAKGFSSHIYYVDPYTATVTGDIKRTDTLMYTIRKLHGELLLGTPGTLVVELVASWFIVLLLTGIYIWWPKSNQGAAGVFKFRQQGGKRQFWRDTHAVTSFWLSVFLVIIISGAMPWTDRFGAQLKWVEKQTNTGYPSTWRSSKGLSSSKVNESAEALTIDDISKIAQQHNLQGIITIKLPKESSDVFTVSNRSLWLSDQQVIHFGQYNGEVIKSHTWEDVGILRDLRQVFMRLHQGEYGTANWFVLLGVALVFIFSTVGGLLSYLKRKPRNQWGIPKVPESFNVGIGLIVIIISMGILFPMFGLSLIVLTLLRLPRFKTKTSKPQAP